MYHYAVLTEKLLPISFLTYSSQEDLAIGQLVEVSIRNTLEKGVIFKQSRVESKETTKIVDNDETSELIGNFPKEVESAQTLPSEEIAKSKYEVKPIENILPYIFSSNLMNFWQSVAFNNFSSMNRVLSAGLESFNLLIKADWKIITENYNNKILAKNENSSPNNNFGVSQKPDSIKIGKTEYLHFNNENITDKDKNGDIESILRIMYLIRNVQYKNTLIIFPEIKLLKKWLSQINLKEFSDVHLYSFTSGKDKASKATIKSLLLPDSKNIKKNVYFTTRAGLFLPYNQISAIFVIDESNSMHIQEQGGLYFDVRETSYILASQFGSDLYYQSNFPSVRFSDLAKSSTTNH